MLRRPAASFKSEIFIGTVSWFSGFPAKINFTLNACSIFFPFSGIRRPALSNNYCDHSAAHVLSFLYSIVCFWQALWMIGVITEERMARKEPHYLSHRCVSILPKWLGSAALLFLATAFTNKERGVTTEQEPENQPLRGMKVYASCPVCPSGRCREYPSHT
jgi:hypothetical protein